MEAVRGPVSVPLNDPSADPFCDSHLKVQTKTFKATEMGILNKVISALAGCYTAAPSTSRAARLSAKEDIHKSLWDLCKDSQTRHAFHQALDDFQNRLDTRSRFSSLTHWINGSLSRLAKRRSNGRGTDGSL